MFVFLFLCIYANPATGCYMNKTILCVSAAKWNFGRSYTLLTAAACWEFTHGRHDCGAGKRAGVVTTTRVTHATPAASYAHSAHRDWESDDNVPLIYRNKPLCRDIAAQLVDDNSDINVRKRQFVVIVTVVVAVATNIVVVKTVIRSKI